ncbi:hypothetical protein Tco_0047918 [Tanacetum coccineum]
MRRSFIPNQPEKVLPEQVERDQQLLLEVLQSLLALCCSSFPLPPDETPPYHQPLLNMLSSKTRALLELSCLLEAARQSLACIRLGLLSPCSKRLLTLTYLLRRLLALTLSHEETCCSLPPEETDCSLPSEETCCALPSEETGCSLPPEETYRSLPPEETPLFSYCLWT